MKQESEVDYVMMTTDGHGIKNIAKISVLLTDSLGNTASCSDMDLTLLAPYARCDGSLGKRIVLEFHPVTGVKNGDLNRFCKIGAFGTPSINANPMTLQPLDLVYPEQDGTYSDPLEGWKLVLIIVAVVIVCICCSFWLRTLVEPEPSNTPPRP